MKQTYRVLAGLVALGVLVQAAAIAFGWFDAISEVDKGAVIDENYEGNAGHMIHAINGMLVMPALGLILLIVSFFAAKQVPGARMWAGIVFGLIVLQVALAFAAFSAPVVGTLHGINALAIIGVAGRAAALTRTSPAAARRQMTGPVDVPAQSTGSAAPQSTRPV
ncbi:hypothetical protein [Blastococcus sp. PRF04-17]|uniref:hypothetical protein n=1 Tax=Blastococcus sp. PRF04-17 TaxID=2933797 RepID=UPI001FF62C5E|nr:hypothetical protein [Blastococcus sp. PRF04-17]UOY03862.1 hypothetical protein MVA48_11280 [Blastococcus sp. PRF04-17]